MTTKSKQLTETQKKILRGVADGQGPFPKQGSCAHSGRGGWNTAQCQNLESRGLLTKGKKFTWEQDWKLTTLGRETLRELELQGKDRDSNVK